MNYNRCSSLAYIKGKGTPTTGIIPITINTLIKINKEIET